MENKILVTGGAGFIGSYIVKELVKQNNRVIVLDDLRTGTLKNLEKVINKIIFVQDSILNKKTLEKVMKGVDIVYHLAAEVGVNRVIGRDKEIWENDYIGTKMVLDEAIKNNVKKFLFASTSEVYGKFDQENLPMIENSNFTANTIYGKAKLESEKLVSEYSKKYGIFGVSTRFFNVYGPGQTLNGYCVPSFIDAILRKKNITIHGDGSQTRDLTYVEDAVKLTMALLDDKNIEKIKGEVFNIGTGLKISMNELSRRIINITDSNSKIIYSPKRRPADGYHKQGDITKIIKTTGLKPNISLEEGLRRTIKKHQEKIFLSTH